MSDQGEIRRPNTFHLKRISSPGSYIDSAPLEDAGQGFFLSREKLEMRREKGALLSTQPLLNDEDAFDFLVNPAAQEKWIEVTDSTNTIYPLAKDAGVNTAFATDLPMDRELAARQGSSSRSWGIGSDFTKPSGSRRRRPRGSSPCTGPGRPIRTGPGRDPGGHVCRHDPDGQKSPLEDLDLVGDSKVDFVVIMKDGVV